MSIKTSIGWAKKTHNPMSGCSPVSEGCYNCYAARLAGTRLKNHPKYKGLTTRREDGSYRFTGEIRLHPDELETPLRWRKPSRVFVCSMCDLFHKNVPFEFVANVFQTIADSPQHLFLILTKRPGRMKLFFDEWWNPDITDPYLRGGRQRGRPRLYLRKPGCSECRSFFLGCLNGRKKWADRATTPNYRETGHLDYFGHPDSICDAFRWSAGSRNHGVAVAMDNGEISVREDALAGPFPSPLRNLWLGVTAENQNRLIERIQYFYPQIASIQFVSFEPLLGLIDISEHAGLYDWGIIGAETGPGKRPPELQWIMRLVKQHKEHGIPLFMKDNLKPYWPHRLIQEWPD